MMNKLAIFLGLALVIGLASCEIEEGPSYVFPDRYLPAYPGSYWDYTNGERVISTGYDLHSYEESINSTEKTSEAYVPFYNGQYLYEYSVYQHSTLYPLKKLLSESATTWEVNEANGELVKRTSSLLDSIVIPFPPFTAPIDCVIYDLVVVVEYLDSLGASRWNLKEYYADSIGLVRVEINNPFDTLGPVVQKQIQAYSILWDEYDVE